MHFLYNEHQHTESLGPLLNRTLVGLLLTVRLLLTVFKDLSDYYWLSSKICQIIQVKTWLHFLLWTPTGSISKFVDSQSLRINKPQPCDVFYPKMLWQLSLRQNIKYIQICHTIPYLFSVFFRNFFYIERERERERERENERERESHLIKIDIWMFIHVFNR